MRVRCTRIVNPITLNEERQSPWLTIGKEYIVLAIYFPHAAQQPVYLLVSDDDSKVPVRFKFDQFEVICGKVPQSWVVSAGDAEMMSFAPNDWLRTGFWEDYFDAHPDAVNAFATTVALIESQA
jgi:hypothetical protein